MKLLVDTREQQPLEFPKMQGVKIVTQKIFAGDYAAMHLSMGHEVMDHTVIERKELGDLFNSFTGGYLREKAKMQRAKQAGFRYIVAVEGSASDVLKGHYYHKGGELYQTKKTGLAMLRQLMSWERRGYAAIWFCANRKDMALRILEFFLANERIPVEESDHVHELC